MKVKRFESCWCCWYYSSSYKRWGDLAMELIQTKGNIEMQGLQAAKANARGPRTHQGGGSLCSALAPAPPTALPALLAAHQAVN